MCATNNLSASAAPHSESISSNEQKFVHSESISPNENISPSRTICQTCFRHCRLAEGEVGFCRARKNCSGVIRAENYGKVTSLALDPIEKKPLAKFMSGSYILSLGSYGCNLRCPFCQNYTISQAASSEINTETMTPEEVAQAAYRTRNRGNIGVAYTYNEPLVGWEFVRDTAKIVRSFGMKNVIVTNGCVSSEVLDEVLPFTDAMNIDLKCFTVDGYKKLGGDFEMVKAAITKCASRCHVELTTLIVPGLNDTAEEIDALAKWVAENTGRETVLHITRFFPRWKMTDTSATDVNLIYTLADVASRHLANVVVGNV